MMHIKLNHDMYAWFHINYAGEEIRVLKKWITDHLFCLKIAATGFNQITKIHTILNKMHAKSKIF